MPQLLILSTEESQKESPWYSLQRQVCGAVRGLTRCLHTQVVFQHVLEETLSATDL